MEIKFLALPELNVDISNYRIGEFDTQRESIKAMLEQQGPKIVELASDIMDIGLNPTEMFIVIPDPEEDGFYQVCEGNRRTTALKVMETPSLAAGTEVGNAFKALSLRFAEKPIRMVQCAVFEEKIHALPWIVRKHSNRQTGRGVERWDADGQARFEASIGIVRRSKAVMDFLRSKGHLSPELQSSMRRKTTTADRVFNMPYFVSTLGVSFDNATGAVSFGNGDEQAGSVLLKAVITKIADKSFTVNDVRAFDQRIAFIDIFAPLATKAPQAGNRSSSWNTTASNGAAGSDAGQETGGASKNLHTRSSSLGNAAPCCGTAEGTKDGTDTATAEQTDGSQAGGGSGRSSLDRKTLAPTERRRTFKANDPRLKRVYLECRKIKVAELPNASGLLLRVFVELSTDFYLERMNVALPAKLKARGKKKWSEWGISLAEKVGAVVWHMDSAGKDRELDAARKAQTDPDALHSIDTLHGYMHNRHAEPEPMELKRSWERWHPYLKRLHDSE